MTNRDDSRQCNHTRHGRGPSSIWIHDPEQVFAGLELRPGEVVLDLGCGPGDYSIRAAGAVGGEGMVYALDRQDEAIKDISEKIIQEGCSNIRVIKADITQPLPLKDGQADVCLLSTVLHIFQVKKAGAGLFPEIHRVLRPGGRLAIIELKKEDQHFGPPKHMRLSPREVEEIAGGHGFKKIGLIDLGYSYLIQFRAE